MSKQSEAAARRARAVADRKRRGDLRLVVNRDEIAKALPDRMITFKEIVVLTGADRLTIRALLDAKSLPPPIMLGPRTLRWWLSDVMRSLDKLRAKPGPAGEGPRLA